MEGTTRQPGPPGESKIERPCVSSQAPGGRALGSTLFGGILVGTSCSQEQCLDFFLSSSLKKKKNLIEGREGLEPLTEQLSIREASGTVCP